MCGIVLAGASSVMGTKDLGIFEKLLFCDTFRGDHSTGVMSGYHHLGHYIVDVNKAAINGPEFIESECWVKAKGINLETPTAAGSVVTKKTPYFLVGHNRYATMGAKTTTNAHPFQVGDVTLVHNGTLIDQSLLPDHERFVVDSHNIAHAINKEGIAETIKKLHGAFTLVWSDTRDNTVNIIRNSERPFHLAMTNSGDWFGASEEDMLMWILNRDNKAGKVKVSPVKKHFECEVGVQYVFDVKDGKFIFKEEIKHELPEFKSYYTPRYNYGAYGWGNQYSPYNSTDRNERANAYLKDLNVKVGDEIKFCSYNFKKYMSSNVLGTLEGFVNDSIEYVDVIAHGFAEAEYTKHGDYVGRISNAYIDRSILTVIVTAAKKFVQSEVVVEPPSDERITADDGSVFSRVEWEKSPQSTCRSCLTHIPFDEAASAVAVGDSSYLCWKCESDLKKDIAETGYTFLPAPITTELTFVCEGCKEVTTLAKESDFLHGHCEDCAAAYYEHRDTKELDNGLCVNKNEWEDFNTCIYCRHDVPWEDATKCTVIGDACICFDCAIDAL